MDTAEQFLADVSKYIARKDVPEPRENPAEYKRWKADGLALLNSALSSGEQLAGCLDSAAAVVLQEFLILLDENEHWKTHWPSPEARNLWPRVAAYVRQFVRTKSATPQQTQVIDISKAALAQALGHSTETLRKRIKSGEIQLHGEHSTHAKRAQLDVMKLSPDDRERVLTKAGLDTLGAVPSKPNGKPR
jgi:hypothetical protein